MNAPSASGLDAAAERPSATAASAHAVAAATLSVGDLVVLDWSPALAELTGVTPDQARGRPLADVLFSAETAHDSIVQALARMDATGFAVATTAFARQDASVFRAHLALTLEAPAPGAPGAPTLISAAFDPLPAQAPQSAVCSTVQRRYRAAMEAAGVGAITLELADRSVRLSAEAAEILGFPPKARVETGDRWASRIHPADVERVRETGARQLAGDEDTHQLDCRVLGADGLYVWVRLRTRIERGEDGEIARIQGAMLDVDDERRRDAAMVEIRERFELALDAAELGLWTWNLTSGRMSWSDVMRRMIGVDDAAPANWQRFEDRLHPDERDGVVQAIFASADACGAGAQHNGGAAFALEHRLRAEDGGYRWMTARGKAIYGPDGRAHAIACALSDVTDQKTTQLELLSSEERFADIVALAGECVVEFDARGRITFLAEQARTVLGAPPTQLIGRTLRALIGCAEPAARRRLLAAALHCEQVRGHEIATRCKGGEERWLRFTGRTRRARDGGRRGWRGVIANVTAAKRQELALVEAKQAAEAAARAKAQFLATMSHEIRTPLNAVLGIMGLLRDAGLGEIEQGLIETADDAARHLLTLINDVLDFSKLEEGRAVLEDIPFSLSDLIAETTTLFSALAMSKGLALRASVEDAARGQFRGDPARLRQVLSNLVANAVKFTEQGEVRVNARLTHAGRARIEVVDTGIGVAPEAVPHLFEDFTQAEAGTTRRFGGTGLGLAICRRLVTLMNGEIGVDSTPGAGSTFFVELPIARAVCAEPREKDDAEADAAPPGPALRVLVAEDTPSNQILMRALLTRLGHACVIAEDGQSALDASRAQRFDVVFTDIEMPRLDGYAVAAELSPHAPVFALSAHEISPEDLAAAGFAGHVKKPFEREAIMNALDFAEALARAHEAPLVDAAILGPIVGLAGADAMRQASAVFWECADDALARTRTAVADHDAEAISRAAHELKGSAANIGAARASSLAEALERASAEHASALFEALDEALAATRPAIDAYLDDAAA